MHMTLQQAADALRLYIKLQIPAFLWGAPGIGKSDLAHQIAAELGFELVDVRLSQMDAVDVRGIPSVTADGFTMWNPPAIFPRHDGRKYLVFWDEMNTAPQSVQVTAYQAILDNRIGEYLFPAGTVHVGAGNRQSDKAAAQRMPSALANRFAHIEVSPSIESWATWANGAGINPLLVAFLRFRDIHLHVMPKDDAKAFPTPRSWSRVSRILDELAPGSNLLHAMAAGIVGEAAAGELVSFVQMARAVPPLAAILSNPDGAPVPAEASVLYAVATALARKADKTNFAAVLKYLGRIPAEFARLGVNDAIRRDPTLKSTAAYVQFEIENQGVIL